MNEKNEQTDGRIILFVHLAGLFPVLSPLLDIVLESIN